jgi:hypothetical protein
MALDRSAISIAPPERIRTTTMTLGPKPGQPAGSCARRSDLVAEDTVEDEANGKGRVGGEDTEKSDGGVTGVGENVQGQQVDESGDGGAVGDNGVGGDEGKAGDGGEGDIDEGKAGDGGEGDIDEGKAGDDGEGDFDGEGEGDDEEVEGRDEGVDTDGDRDEGEGDGDRAEDEGDGSDDEGAYNRASRSTGGTFRGRAKGNMGNIADYGMFFCPDSNSYCIYWLVTGDDDDWFATATHLAQIGKVFLFTKKTVSCRL